jgi:hypothetical protein
MIKLEGRGYLTNESRLSAHIRTCDNLEPALASDLKRFASLLKLPDLMPTSVSMPLDISVADI